MMLIGLPVDRAVITSATGDQPIIADEGADPACEHIKCEADFSHSSAIVPSCWRDEVSSVAANQHPDMPAICPRWDRRQRRETVGASSSGYQR